MDKTLAEPIARYKNDPESVYNTWFVDGDERLKAFRSIRRGVQATVDAIAAGTFGSDFKGSPLETVLSAVTEQKQVFAGAAHPFFWKPKLRIPDIYENERNKRTFGSFLQACLGADREEQVLAQMSRLAAARIKGLGPAVANIVYFLHPTIVPPFNTAMVNGFNALFNAKKKLGSWDSYLEMREVILKTNAEVRDQLSKDLGAMAGLLFEIGAGRIVVPGNAEAVLRAASVKAEAAARRRHEDVIAGQRQESEHTRVQHLLIKIGRALKYDVHVARNDRHCSCQGEAFALLTIPDIPPQPWPQEVLDTVSLIDVLWLKADTGEIVSAFEIEKSTSIYSGMLRLTDLARSIPGRDCGLYLVAPDDRAPEVEAQFKRPAFSAGLDGFPLGFIPFHDLFRDGDALCKFGDDHTILRKITRFRLGGAS